MHFEFRWSQKLWGMSVQQVQRVQRNQHQHSFTFYLTLSEARQTVHTWEMLQENLYSFTSSIDTLSQWNFMWGNKGDNPQTSPPRVCFFYQSNSSHGNCCPCVLHIMALIFGRNAQSVNVTITREMPDLGSPTVVSHSSRSSPHNIRPKLFTEDVTSVSLKVCHKFDLLLEPVTFNYFSF